MRRPVLIDGRYLNDHYPGIGRYLFNLLRVLPGAAPADEFAVLVDPLSPSTRFDLSELRQPKLELVPLRVRARSFREQWALPIAARRLRADLFHSPFLLTSWALRRPLVLTLYDLTPFLYPKSVPSAAARLALALASRRAVRSACQVITVSESSRHDLEDHFGRPRDRVVVAPPAVDPALGPATPEAVRGLRRQWDLPTRYVLYLGINKPHKNLARLVEGWAELASQELRDVTLVIAGRPDPRFPEARRRADQLALRTVRFLGDIPEDDLAALYTGAELFVFPSLYEGFGLPVIEAMACGAAVACSNSSSLPEVAGDAADLFDPHSASAIAGSIARVLGDPRWRSELSRRGLARARQFSWQETARRTLEAYEEARARQAAASVRLERKGR